MRKSILISLILLLFPMTHFSQISRPFQFHYDISDFKFSKEKDGVTSIRSAKYIINYGEGRTECALPLISIGMLVGSDEEFLSLTTSEQETLQMQDVVVKKNEAGCLEGKSTKLPPTVAYTGYHLIDGYKILTFEISPFRYDEKERQLYLKGTVTFKVNTTANAKEKTSQVRLGKNMRKIVASYVINPSEMDSLYKETAQMQENGRTLDNQAGYKYIIVTCDSLKSAFTPLVEWKILKGLRAKVLTTEEIDSIYGSEPTRQLRIKRALNDYYEDGLVYALLGGDTFIVPAQICYLRPFKNCSTETPCDLFYASFDRDFGWNRDGDTLFGEEEDSIDMAPEIVLSRIPVANSNDASAFVNRVINYERNPNTEAWKDGILMCGSMLYGYLDNGISDAQYSCEELYNNYIAPHWGGDKYRFYDTETDHPNGANYNVYPNNLKTQLNKGWTFAHITSHGRSSGWSLENNTFFDTSKASELNNPRTTVITTSACSTNSFDVSCLSEYFMKNPNSGILSYYGASRETITDDADDYVGMFYRELLMSDEKSPGCASTNNKMLHLAYESHNVRYNFAFNLIGDPEMSVYTEHPVCLSPLNVYTYNNSIITMHYPKRADFLVTLQGANSNGSYIYESEECDGYTDIPQNSLVCISSAGYQPFVFKIINRNTICFQEANFEGDISIGSKNLVVGKHAISNDYLGKVTVLRGRTSLSASNSVTIDSNFEVRGGAELTISISDDF